MQMTGLCMLASTDPYFQRSPATGSTADGGIPDVIARRRIPTR